MALDLSLECAVENAADLTVEEFRRKYLIPQKPVLLKGLANLQPAGKKWTIDWFKQEMGDLEVGVFDNTKERHVYSTTVNPDFNMPFGEFLDIITKKEPSTIRMFRYNLYKQYPSLKKDFSCPKFINKGIMKTFGFMFLGGTDTEVRLHYDVDNSNVLLTQIHGTKRVVLFAPDQGKYLYKVPYNTHSLAELKDPDFEKWPGLKHVKGCEVIQEAGDGIFMPSGYWHYNTYLEGGISVAYRMLAQDPVTLMKGAFFMGFTMPFDKIMNMIFGKKWFERKKKLSIARVNKAIS
ncbi:cupin-like domain-containing protein [bacterium SCSIO 12643]|nr:cupin-like domain-containing protein [bacterium SCSIO 12643]